MIKCDYCGKEEEDNCGYTKNYCDSCVSDKEIGVPHLEEKVFLKDYGMVEKSRLREMDRRVILPYNAPDGGYYVGRRCENGKIAEREPSY